MKTKSTVLIGVAVLGLTASASNVRADGFSIGITFGGYSPQPVYLPPPVVCHVPPPVVYYAPPPAVCYVPPLVYPWGVYHPAPVHPHGVFDLRLGHAPVPSHHGKRHPHNAWSHQVRHDPRYYDTRGFQGHDSRGRGR